MVGGPRATGHRSRTPNQGADVSSSDILERPDVRDADTGSANEVFPVTKTPKPGSPVCPACKEVYNQLKKE